MHECVRSKSCGPGTVCWPNAGQASCVESDCSMEGTGCPPDETCRPISLSQKVFRCVHAGKAVEESTCADLLPVRDDLGCAAGLSCWHGRCRRRCGTDHDCAQGGRCVAKSPVERVCARDVCLTDKDCPAGRPACIEMKDGAPSSCMRVADKSCRPGRCGAGQACDAQLDGDQLVGQCRTVCDDVHSSCGVDEVCRPPAGAAVDNVALPAGFCYRHCSFKTPAGCGSGETCGTLGGDSSVTVCRPAIAGVLVR